MATLSVGGTTVFDGAVLQSGVTGTGITSGTITSGVTFPSGHIIQVQGTHNDYNWGSWGHSTETHCGWADVILTTRGTNSNFWVTGRINADNTTTGPFGIGIGFRYQPTGGSEVIICEAHEHENYSGPSGDYYHYSMHQIYEVDATIAKDTEVTFKVYMEFNNSNGQWASQSQHGTSHTVMEIQA